MDLMILRVAILGLKYLKNYDDFKRFERGFIVILFFEIFDSYSYGLRFSWRIGHRIFS